MVPLIAKEHVITGMGTCPFHVRQGFDACRLATETTCQSESFKGKYDFVRRKRILTNRHYVCIVKSASHKSSRLFNQR
jgi:hypothetical protein